MKLVVDYLFKHAESQPQKSALFYGGQEVSYHEMARRVVAVAKYFQQLGVKKNDSIILSADSTAAFVYGYFACHVLSAVCVPIDPNCSQTRLSYIIEKMQPKAVFTSKNYNIQGIFHELISELLNCTPDVSADISWSSLSLGSIADVLFTSGTTGDAKGVMLSQRAISAATCHINDFIQNSSDDREIMPLPLSHSFGLGRLRCNIVKGSTIILVPGLTSPALIFQNLDRFTASGLASVPAGFAILLSMTGDHLAQYSEQLRYIEIGSAPMPTEHKKQLMRLLPKTRITMHYGLTEASRSVFSEFNRDKKRLSTIGKPASGVEVKIVDDHGNDCKIDETGKILVKGKHCMQGYWKDAALTKKIFKNGWLETGDVGFRDNRDYFYLVSRESELINVGGLKVAPAEIEKLIITHPSIHDCACIGIPDPRNITGKVVKAFLVKAEAASELPTKQEIDKLLRGKIETYKMPFCYEWISDIPKTESGKVKRRDLVKQYIVDNE